RGIAIEFRSHVADALWRAFWDGVFALASTLLPVLLGAALGNVVRGVPLDAGGEFQIPLFIDFSARGPVGVLDWYTLLMGVFVLVTLTAHGALFVALKTLNPVQFRCHLSARAMWLAVVALTLGATWATLRVNPALIRSVPHAPAAW